MKIGNVNGADTRAPVINDDSADKHEYKHTIRLNESGDREGESTEPNNRYHYYWHSTGKLEIKNTENGDHIYMIPGQETIYTKSGTTTSRDGHFDDCDGGCQRGNTMEERYSTAVGDRSTCTGGDCGHAYLGNYGHASVGQTYIGAGQGVAMHADTVGYSIIADKGPFAMLIADGPFNAEVNGNWFHSATGNARLASHKTNFVDSINEDVIIGSGGLAYDTETPGFSTDAPADSPANPPAATATA